MIGQASWRMDPGERLTLNVDIFSRKEVGSKRSWIEIANISQFLMYDGKEDNWSHIACQHHAGGLSAVQVL